MSARESSSIALRSILSSRARDSSYSPEVPNSLASPASDRSIRLRSPIFSAMERALLAYTIAESVLYLSYKVRISSIRKKLSMSEIPDLSSRARHESIRCSLGKSYASEFCRTASKSANEGKLLPAVPEKLCNGTTNRSNDIRLFNN